MKNACRLIALSLTLATLAFPCAAQKTSAQTAASVAKSSPGLPGLDMTPVKPETVGFSSERLERLHALMQQQIDQKQLAGIVTLLARHGKIVDYRTYGYRDMEAGAPMTKDVIFRDFSMTKPVTGVAMMILYEEGKWLPSDPIAKFIPEFAHLKVFKGLDADGKMILEDPDHPPTMRELMTHTAGFTYGIFGNSPVDKAMIEKRVFASQNLQEFIQKLATIPLAYQPGKGWIYSVSMDIEGYIVEKISGQSLPDFMRDHIFNPLAMKDADFYVPAEKRGRFSHLYVAAPSGGIVDDASGGGLSGAYLHEPTMPMGGGGLVSTTEDYYRFAQMMLNGGRLNGARILAPSSVKLMTSNHVPAELLNGTFSIGNIVLRPGYGWGYNCAVAFDPIEANLVDGKGTFSWGGAAGTWFWADPTNDIVFIGMVQRMLGPSSPNIEALSRAVVYQALVDPSE